MNTYTVPNLETAEGLMNIGPAGKSFLVCRGIAGGMLPDAHSTEVDRLAMTIWMGWDGEGAEEEPVETGANDWDTAPAADPFACGECGGAGRVCDGETCDACGGSGTIPGADYWEKCFSAAPKTDELRAAGIVDPEYIGEIAPTPGNPLGYYRGPQRPASNPVPLEARPHYGAIRERLDGIVSDFHEAAHQAARDFRREPGMWPTANYRRA
jgi:hypothetical protein